MQMNKLIDLLARATHQLTAATKALWQRRASVGEIDRLDSQEKTCLAQDLGISVDEVRALAATDKSAADLLIRRMQTLGFDPSSLAWLSSTGAAFAICQIRQCHPCDYASVSQLAMAALT